MTHSPTEREIAFINEGAIRERVDGQNLNLSFAVRDRRVLLATLDALRASLDPDNEAAVEAWAAALDAAEWPASEYPRGYEDPRWLRAMATALLHARAEAGRP